MGYDDDALQRPMVGVANTWTETMPCNFHLRRLAERVKDGVRAAGATPMEFNTIAISDGITMGTAGMRASLVSREVIADSIELVGRGHMFDAVIALCACDKTIPGTVMALARLDVPSLMLYGGSIAPGRYRGEDVTVQEVYEAIGSHAAGKISDEDLTELENVASPGAGACGGQFTANTMAMAFEVLGISPVGSSMVPAEDGKKGQVAEDCGKLVMDVLRRDLRPTQVITRDSLENAIAGVAMSGGSTNAVLHLLAVANEAGVELTIDDFDRIAWSTPLLGDLKPGGRFVATDLYRAGGVPLVLKRLKEAGLLHEDAITVDGRTIGQAADEAQETEGQEVIRQVSDPLKPNGGFAILRGNLAPEGCVVKLAGHDRIEHSGPARVFESEEDAFAAVKKSEIVAGDVVVIRNEGPAGGPGMREMLQVTAALVGEGWATRWPCSPTGASPAPPTASWPATWRRRRGTAARSPPPSATATRSCSTWPPASSTWSSPRRSSRNASRATSRLRRASRPACSASTPGWWDRPRAARSRARPARPQAAGSAGCARFPRPARCRPPPTPAPPRGPSRRGSPSACR